MKIQIIVKLKKVMIHFIIKIQMIKYHKKKKNKNNCKKMKLKNKIKNKKH